MRGFIGAGERSDLCLQASVELHAHVVCMCVNMRITTNRHHILMFCNMMLLVGLTPMLHYAVILFQAVHSAQQPA